MDIENNITNSAKRSGPSLNISAAICFIIGACIVYLIFTSWCKWGELIIDTFRELLLSEQILKGKVLYQDISYPYGFLPPHLLSWAYMIFGINIYSLVACGIITVILMCVFLYKISHLFLGETYSALTVLTFLFVFAFGFYVTSGIFNFIMPYSLASTISMLFITIALYFFLKFMFVEKPKFLVLWSIFLSLSAFCRPDLTIPLWLGFAFIGALLIIKKKALRYILLYLISPLIIVTLGYCLFLSATHSFSGFRESFIDCIRANIKNPITIHWFGLDEALPNAIYAFKSFIYHLIVISFLGVISLAAFLIHKRSKNSSSPYVLEILAAFVLFIITKKYFESGLQYRCIPIILFIGIIIFLARYLRSSNSTKDLSLLTLFLISLLMIVRILLNATPHNYGFYLLSLGIICYYIFFLKLFPAALNSLSKTGKNPFSVILPVFFLLLIIPHWENSLSMYMHKNIRVKTDKGTVFCWNSKRSVLFWETVAYLRQNTSKDDTIVAFPEGVSLDFFADRNTPLKYYTFLPPDIETTGEDKIVGDLTSTKIDYIAIVSRDTTEYGYPSFGIDYAKKIRAWIDDNYTLVKQFGPMPYTSNEFGIAIFKRKR